MRGTTVCAPAAGALLKAVGLHRIVAACALAGLPLLAGCADQPDPGAANASPKKTVVIRDGAYRPAVVRVGVGDRVTWVNRDAAVATVETGGVGFFDYDRQDHDRRNVFDLYSLSIGEAESVRFDTPGRYRYHSSFDADMTGYVTVMESQ